MIQLKKYQEFVIIETIRDQNRQSNGFFSDGDSSGLFWMKQNDGRQEIKEENERKREKEKVKGKKEGEKMMRFTNENKYMNENSFISF